VADAHVCILMNAPENHVERSVLASLVRRGLPLFSVTEHEVYSLFGRHAVFPLPCETSAPALARFLAWFRPREAGNRAEGDELLEKNRLMVHELRLASELQRSILPRGTPPGLPVNLARKYVPYQYIGGDFYDFVSLGGQRMGLVIADASGHGIAAAFMTAMFKSAFRLYTQDGEPPSRTLARINTEFARTLMTDHFMSAFYLILDATTNTLSYCSAGHPPQLLFRATGEIEPLSTLGFLLGSVDNMEFQDRSVTMQPGDRLLLFTDGIVETADSAGAQFGRARLAEIVRRNFDLSIEEISSELLSEAMMFSDRPTFEDDVTILLAEIAPEL